MKNLIKSDINFIPLMFTVNEYVVFQICGIVSSELFIFSSGSGIFNDGSICCPLYINGQLMQSSEKGLPE